MRSFTIVAYALFWLGVCGGSNSSSGSNGTKVKMSMKMGMMEAKVMGAKCRTAMSEREKKDGMLD